MVSRYDLSPDELAVVLDGEPRYRVNQVWEGLYANLQEPSGQDGEQTPSRGALRSPLPSILHLPATRSHAGRLASPSRSRESGL